MGTGKRGTLYILTGPTAVGKTELALSWAEENGAAILSCDSTLFYKGMDIGTAKPSKEEQERVRHYGIDLVEVGVPYSIKKFFDYAQGVVDEVYGRGGKLLITGGSGFYLKGFVAPVLDGVESTEESKVFVDELYEKKGLEGIVEELRRLNGAEEVGIDVNNPIRVIKALQRCLTTGKTLVELEETFKAIPEPFGEFDKRLTLLDREPEGLNERIELRAKQMLEMGLVEEVEGLLGKGILGNPSAARAIGYREVIEWIESGRKGDLLGEIVKNTRQLVAKQRKWFRNQMIFDKILKLGNNKVVLTELF